jgi:predicted dehydrogenase
VTGYGFVVSPESRTTVRWGVLGTGLIARNHVFESIRRAESCELRAVASRDGRRAGAVAAEYGIGCAYGSYEDLLADPTIDAVYLPLPNHLHAPWIRAAADAGKHVLCEKPLTLDTAEAEAVAAHCRARGVLLMEAFMYRFHPAWVEARRLIATGAVGRILDVAVWFAFRTTRAGDYRLVPEQGGGALLDVGCYAVNVSRMLLGDDPDAVHAVAGLDATTGVDTTFSAILDYGDARCTFTCSMEHESDHRVRIYGTRGWLSIADPFNCPPDRATTITIATGGDDHPHHSSRRVIDVAAADQYGLQATAFARAILQRAASPLPVEDSVANMRLIGRLSAAAGLDGPQAGKAAIR